MPEKMERALRKSGKKRGLKGDALDAYIYGTMQEKTDWRPSQKSRGKRRGKMMEPGV